MSDELKHLINRLFKLGTMASCHGPTHDGWYVLTFLPDGEPATTYFCENQQQALTFLSNTVTLHETKEEAQTCST